MSKSLQADAQLLLDQAKSGNHGEESLCFELITSASSPHTYCTAYIAGHRIGIDFCRVIWKNICGEYDLLEYNIAKDTERFSSSLTICMQQSRGPAYVTLGSLSAEHETCDTFASCSLCLLARANGLLFVAVVNTHPVTQTCYTFFAYTDAKSVQNVLTDLITSAQREMEVSIRVQQPTTSSTTSTSI